MATSKDAELVLKLYELRTEATMRKARAFVAMEFQPKSAEELAEIRKAMGSEQNAYWRQVISYWEMAASLVLRGAVDAELFLDSAAEGIFLYAKFERFAGDSRANFMPQTGKLIEKYAQAKTHYEGVWKRLEAAPAAG